MAFTEIYYKTWCPFSQAALELLEQKGVNYVGIDLTSGDGAKEQEMRRRSGRTSVPQIFINGAHIGGYDEIQALERAGELDSLFAQSIGESA